MILVLKLYKVVLTFIKAVKTLVCDHSNESFLAVLKKLHWLFQPLHILNENI